MTTNQGMKRTGKAIAEAPVRLMIYPETSGQQTGGEGERFNITPLSIGTLSKISLQLLRFPPFRCDTSNEGELKRYTEQLTSKAHVMARIVAYAIVNRKKEPSKKLVRFLLYNLTAGDMEAIAEVLFKGMDTKPLEDFYRLAEKRKKQEDDHETPPVDTLWTLIGIICKYWKWSEYAVKWKMSYQNAMMYLKCIPVYNAKKDKGKESGDPKEFREAESLEEFMKFGIE